MTRSNTSTHAQRQKLARCWIFQKQSLETLISHRRDYQGHRHAYSDARSDLCLCFHWVNQFSHEARSDLCLCCFHWVNQFSHEARSDLCLCCFQWVNQFSHEARSDLCLCCFHWVNQFSNEVAHIPMLLKCQK